MVKKNSSIDGPENRSDWFCLGHAHRLKGIILPFAVYGSADGKWTRLRQAGSNDGCLDGIGHLYGQCSARNAWAGFLLGKMEREARRSSTSRDRVRSVIDAGVATMEGWLIRPHRPEYDALVDRWVTGACKFVGTPNAPQHLLPVMPTGTGVPVHAVRTALVIGCLGRELHWSAQTRKDMVWAAFSHDIGHSLGLDEGDFNHVNAGLALLGARFKLPKLVYEAIRHHHEYRDGSGNPYGIRGRDIPWSANLLALVDNWDENRPICGPLNDIKDHWQGLRSENAGSFEERWSELVDSMLDNCDDTGHHSTTP